MIELEGLGFSYPLREGSIPVLRDLSCGFAAGTITAIVGPSGSGKTSLLRLLAGLAQPTTGRITIGGEPGGRIRSRTSLIFQDYGLLPWETVEGNAELGLAARGLPKSERASLVRPILQDLGLGLFSRLYPARLSGGMRQRVAVARALAAHSDLLLMDEPFSSLDALTRENLQDTLLRTQARYGTTIVLVTHSIEEAVYLADSVYILEGKNPSTLSERIVTARGKSRAGSSVGPASSPAPLAAAPDMAPSSEAIHFPASAAEEAKRLEALPYRESAAYFDDLRNLRRRFFASGNLAVAEEDEEEKAPGQGPRASQAASQKRKVLLKPGSFGFHLAKIVQAAVLVLLLWEGLALLLAKPFLPLPGLVFAQFARGLALGFSRGLGGSLLSHTLSSLRRVLGAILLAAPPAWFLGLAAGRVATADALVSPLVYLLHPLPKVAFLPILMLLLGLGDASKLALMGLVVFGQLFVGARDSAKAIPPSLADTVRSLGGGKTFLLRKVVLPSTLPALLSSLRISLGTAIAVLFLSETFASVDGLGWYIMDAWSRVDYPDMYAAILALSFLGLFLYLALDGLEALLLRWREI